MKSQSTKIIRSTAENSAGDGIYIPFKRFNLHQRINHRAEYMGAYHIGVCFAPPLDNSHAARLDRYEVTCLEKGLRPWGYPENLWQEYLRDVADEEHIAKCEAKNAWMYEY